ncbi:hypothetical protein AB0A95_30685 [Micromonospora sp. NPDC049230]|uniref:hypothetical protein n=1 Tax=Micromonospora sp. NPDC049230 TaxID=3155502 RepID=UPI0033E2A98E
MAYESFPNNQHNNRVITLAEHEQIVAPNSLSGIVGPFLSIPPVFADGTGRHVKLRAGVKASILGTRFNNLTETLIPIGENTSGKNRIDLVVLRLRRQESSLGAGDQYTIAPYVIQGGPADNPVAPPPVRNDTPGSGFWDIPIDEVYVVNGVTSIGSGATSCQAYHIAGSGYVGRWEWAFPPVEAGVVFRDEQHSVTYIGTGSGTWQSLYEDTSWAAVGVAAGWSTAPTGKCRIRRVNRVAYFQLDLFRTGGSLPLGGSRQLVAVLPPQFETDQQVTTLGSVTVAGSSCRFSVDPANNVIIDMYSAIPTGQAISVLMQWPTSVV